MKIAEKILAALSILGMLLRMAHISGGAMLSILALGIFSMFYFAAGFFLFNPTQTNEVNGLQYKTTNVKRVVIAVFTGMTLSVALIGFLFKLMRWPGALAMILIAIISLIPIVIVAAIRLQKTNADFYKQVLIRSVIFGLLALGIFVASILQTRYGF